MHELVAEAIHRGFESYLERFREQTRLARWRFEKRDWRGGQEDARVRLDLYSRAIEETLTTVRTAIGERADLALTASRWKSVRSSFADSLGENPNPELLQTFYNSICRRIFSTIGVNPEVEIVGAPSPIGTQAVRSPMVLRYPRDLSTAALVGSILSECPHAQLWQDLPAEVAAVSAALERQLAEQPSWPPLDAIEILSPVFYRNKGAYRVGRLRCGERVAPFVLALVHEPAGLRVDAVLFEEDDVSVVFSFTHSYFQVDAPCPRDLVRFLRSILPLKPVAELYTSLGHHRHGKTELYRNLMEHFAESPERFRIAPGRPGMVMMVFTLPGLDLVFKVIRDRFAPPKTATRREVMEQYRVVFRHDRVGRLVDAQEFEHLAFRLDRFEPELLAELRASCAGSIAEEGRQLILKHLYTERRVVPLDLYVREQPTREAEAAIVDWGMALKDLAAADIFPGDFLLKNFGVTRHGRVVFYDYDELCLLSECNFRRLPPARRDEDEMASEPWFSVGPSDIFPEEFPNFLGLPEPLAKVFTDRHGDLFSAPFWKDTQARILGGEILDVYPYPKERRLRR